MSTREIGLVLLLLLAPQAHATEEQFCRGFAQGYVEGWNGVYAPDKYGNVVDVRILGGTRKESPPVPACQIGALENNDNSTLSSFEQGQQKGIQRGIKAYKDDLGTGSPTDIARRAAAAAKQKADAAQAQVDAEAAKKKQAEDKAFLCSKLQRTSALWANTGCDALMTPDQLVATQASDRNACWKHYEAVTAAEENTLARMTPQRAAQERNSPFFGPLQAAKHCWSLPGANLDGILVSSAVTAQSAAGTTYKCSYRVGDGRTATVDETPPDGCPQVFSFTAAPTASAPDSKPAVMARSKVAFNYFPILDLGLPPKPSVSAVDVYQLGEKITRPSGMLGTMILESDGQRTLQQLVDSAREKAVEVGADFIIVVKTTTHKDMLTDPSFSYAIAYLSKDPDFANPDRQGYAVLRAYAGAYTKAVVGVLWNDDARKEKRYVVQSFQPYSSAPAAGLKVGDEVLTINGMSVLDTRLQKLAFESPAGTKFTYHIKRADQQIDVQVQTVTPH